MAFSFGKDRIVLAMAIFAAPIAIRDRRPILSPIEACKNKEAGR
jgi:hypothetical protein